MPKFKIKQYDTNHNERKVSYMDTDEIILYKLSGILQELDDMPAHWTMEIIKERD